MNAKSSFVAGLLRGSAIAVLGSATFVSSASAQTNYFWAGQGANTGLTTTNNWFNAATGGSTSTPSSSDATRLQFGTRAATGTTVNNATDGFNVSGITFNSGVHDIYSFNITGSRFEYKKNGSINPFITQNSVNNHSISGGFKLAEPLTLDGNGTGLVTLNGTWEGGSKGLTKNGSSAFLITGAATTVGTTTINGGTLALSGAGALGVIQLRGGVLAQSGTFSRALGTGATNINFGAGGGGFAAYGGDLNVTTNFGTWGDTNSFQNAHPLILGSSIANGIVTLSTGFSLGTSGTNTREIRMVNNVNSTADRAVISGAISGSVGNSLNLTGAGDLTLSGNNTFTGTTTVGNGVKLTLSNNFASPLSIASAGEVLITGGTISGSASVSGLMQVNSGATISGAVTVQNGGTLIANGNFTQIVEVLANGSIGGTGAVAANITFSSGSQFIFNPTTALTVSSGTVTFSNFGVANLIGFNWEDIEDGVYNLMVGGATFNTSGLLNLGSGNAFEISDGRFAYFKEGSLQLVVDTIPEPSTALLGALGAVVFLRRRRVNARL